MTFRSVMLQLSEAQIDELDRAARRQGVSRSQMVRDAVDALVNPPPDTDIATAYAAAYPTPADGADEWGDLDAWHQAARTARNSAGTGRNDRGAW